MATEASGNAGTGSNVAAPENKQPQVPVEQQLNELKISAKDKINDLVGSSKEQFERARNDPTNRAAGDQVAQDAAVTTQDAAQSYNTALNQLGEAFQTAATTGKQVAQQLGLAGDQASAGTQDLTTAARQQAQQRSIDAVEHARGGKTALQQGIAKVQDALTQGAAVANQKLQQYSQGADTAGSNSGKAVQAGDQQSPTLFQSVTNVLSQTAQSVKGALWSPPEAHSSSDVNPGLPADVPRSNTE